jgi:hypothetical protein
MDKSGVFVGVVAVALAACGGASMQERKEARDALYQTDLDTVWNAVRAEMRDGYASVIEVEDPQQGLIKTGWKTIEAERDSSAEDAPQPFSSGANKEGNKGRVVFRIYTKVEPGGPPWYVWVDGEAARYIPGSPMLQPFKRGTEDEPRWVDGRVDRVRLGIHRRLKAYAVTPAAATATP